MLQNGVAPGLIALVAVLAAATGFGVFWQRRNGRMRVPRAARTAAGAEAAGGAGPAGAGPAGPRLTEAELGAALGERVTLLQFSSSFCAPCRATRVLLADVAAAADGVAHVEVNVADRLDLVRLLGVRRTPTVFVLGPDGRIAGQASGQPRRAEVLAAVAAVADAAGAR